MTTPLKDSVAQKLASTDIPPNLIQWLAKFKILLGVPFNYLVPDEQLLPKESIRFFHLDEDWINSLMDGALSIGRQFSKKNEGTNPTLLADSIHHGSLHSLANGSLSNFRTQQLSGQPTENAPDDFPAISGFLLRSDVVKGWKSLDFLAYEKGHSAYDYQQCIITADEVEQMTVLRLEPLSENVLFGLFVGSIYELVVHQPPEAIHFGFQETKLSNDKVTKNLRVPNNNWDDPKGWDLDYKNQELTNGVVANADERVLDMYGLSKALGKLLATQSINKAPGYYSAQPDANQVDHLLSSDFGLEMVQGVGLVSYINYQQDNQCQ